MDKCDFIDSCIFVNEQLNDMPYTKKYFLDMYCKSDFKACANYQFSDYSHSSDSWYTPDFASWLNLCHTSSLNKISGLDPLPS
jgi:hypothetical protein